MTTLKEDTCITALDRICKEHFEQDEYSLRGEKESAVCLEKNSNGWSVYESEKNAHNDTCLFDNIVEAGLDFLKRLCTSVDYKLLKNAVLETIISQRIA